MVMAAAVASMRPDASAGWRRASRGYTRGILEEFERAQGGAMRALRRRLAAGLTMGLAAGAADASGIQMEGIGARALGMGGAFTAVADDSSAVYWNPAGLAQLSGRGMSAGLYSMSTWMDMDMGVMNVDPMMYRPEKGDVFAKVYPSEPHHFDDDDVFWPSAATAPEFTAYWNRGRYTLGFGLMTLGGAYSDYEGSGMDMLSGARVDASIYSLFGLVDFNSSIGIQVTDRLNLGFGVDVLVGYLNLDVDKDYLGSTLASQPDYRLDVESESLGFGLQGVFGVQYRLLPRVTVGAVYRSGSRMRLEGETTAKFNGLREDSDQNTRFRYPPTWALGIAWQATDRLLLSADWQGVDWTKFYWPAGRVDYDHPGALLQSVNNDPGWFADDIYRVGAEYRIDQRWTVRGGVYREESGGLPQDFENITYTVSGKMRMANVGVSHRWQHWTGDFLVGTMWGTTSNDSMDHRCLTLALTFRRSFGS
jgi:long-chain fatty acid transport protein